MPRLPGEPETTSDPAVAERWITSYASVLQELTDRAQTAPSAELHRRITSTSERLRWWRRRANEIAGV